METPVRPPHRLTGNPAKPPQYIAFYETLLAPFREEPITLMELGVHTGGSMRMWRDYFTKARIVGVDHLRQTPDIDGVELVWTKQDDPSLAKYEPDIVIDDASHIWGLTTASLELLWPVTRILYVVEDTWVCDYPSQQWAVGPNPVPTLRALGATFHGDLAVLARPHRLLAP